MFCTSSFWNVHAYVHRSAGELNIIDYQSYMTRSRRINSVAQTATTACHAQGPAGKEFKNVDLAFKVHGSKSDREAMLCTRHTSPIQSPGIRHQKTPEDPWSNTMRSQRLPAVQGETKLQLVFNVNCFKLIGVHYQLL